MSELYYAFSMDYEEKSINIGVDDATVSFYFLNCKNFNPIVSQKNDIYSILISDIYNGIDISYDLKPYSVKETMIIKNKYAEKEFSIKIVPNNVKIIDDYENKKIVFINDGTEIFSIPYPFVVEKKKRIPDALMSQYATVLFKENQLIYKFKHENVKKFPVEVDPNFIFTTTIVDGSSYLKDIFNRQNTMYLTGSSYGNDFVQKDMVLKNYLYGDGKDQYSVDAVFSSGKTYAMSDDVLFENKIRVIFPWVYGQGNVKIECNFNGESHYASSVLTSNDIVYNSENNTTVVCSYADFELPFSGSGSLDFLCKLNLSEFRDEIFTYRRKLSYVNDVDILFDNNVNIINREFDDLYLFSSNITVKHYSNFKPISYSVLPFKYFVDESMYQFNNGKLELLNNFIGDYGENSSFIISTNNSKYGQVSTNFGENTTFLSKPIYADIGRSNMEVVFKITEQNIPINVIENDIKTKFCKYEKPITNSGLWIGYSKGYLYYYDQYVNWEDLKLNDQHCVVITIQYSLSILYNYFCDIVGIENGFLKLMAKKENVYQLFPLDILTKLATVPSIIKIINVNESLNLGFPGTKYSINSALKSNFLYSDVNNFYSYTPNSSLSSIIPITTDDVKGLGYSWYLKLSNTKEHDGVYRISKITNSKIYFSDFASDINVIRGCDVSALTDSIIEPIDGLAVKVEVVDLYDISGDVTTEDLSICKGNLSSFVNEMEVILKSAIHDRTNLQESKHFSERYLYASDNDFVYNVTLDQSGENASVVFGVKPFVHIKSNKLFSDLNVMDIQEIDNNTEIIININNDIFTEEFSGGKNISFLTGDIYSEKTFAYDRITENVFKNAYLFAKINDKISFFKILYSSGRKIIIQGRQRSEILNSDHISVCFYNPRKVLFYDDKNSSEMFDLNISDMDDNGVVYFDKVMKNTNNGKIISSYVDFYDSSDNLYVKKQITLS